MFNSRISEIDSPCYDVETKTDCPDRKAGCAVTCKKWADYVVERNKIYEQRVADAEVRSAIIEQTNKVNYRRQRRYISYRQNKTKHD